MPFVREPLGLMATATNLSDEEGKRSAAEEIVIRLIPFCLRAKGDFMYKDGAIAGMRINLLQ